MQSAALAALVLALIAAVVSIASQAPESRVISLLVNGALLTLQALVAYGAWMRARWALWSGMALSAFWLLVLVIVLTLSGSAKEFGAKTQTTQLSICLAWGLIAANAIFLAAALGVLIPRRR